VKSDPASVGGFVANDVRRVAKKGIFLCKFMFLGRTVIVSITFEDWETLVTQ